MSEEFQRWLSELFGVVDPIHLQRDARFVEDLGVTDSLDMIELAQEAEERYGVEFDDDDLNRIKTVGDFHDFLVAHAPGPV